MFTNREQFRSHRERTLQLLRESKTPAGEPANRCECGTILSSFAKQCADCHFAELDAVVTAFPPQSTPCLR
jgi:hypothetical protein